MTKPSRSASISTENTLLVLLCLHKSGTAYLDQYDFDLWYNHDRAIPVEG